MAIEVIENEDMPFLVRGVASYISIDELLDILKKVPRISLDKVAFTLNNGEFVTNSRSFAILVANYG